MAQKYRSLRVHLFTSSLVRLARGSLVESRSVGEEVSGKPQVGGKVDAVHQLPKARTEFSSNFSALSFLTSIASPQPPDHELVQAYKQSLDLEVLGRLYSRYMELVYGVCLKYLKDSENAKDSTLAIFEELVVKLQKHEVENFKSWLYQVAKNHCLMLLRSEKKFSKAHIDVGLVQNEEPVHLNGMLEKEDAFRQLHICLDQLAAEQKQVVELFYLQEKCYNEIAELTGLEWNRVRSYIQNGRRNLKICMEKQKNQQWDA
jgi:RNA polymerase sigma factor (sigma-70 family)